MGFTQAVRLEVAVFMDTRISAADHHRHSTAAGVHSGTPSNPASIATETPSSSSSNEDKPASDTETARKAQEAREERRFFVEQAKLPQECEKVAQEMALLAVGSLLGAHKGGHIAAWLTYE